MLKRRLLALVSALVMLATLIPMAAFTASAELGGDFPWTEGQTLLEQILERDGFIDGIWYPWINAGSSGHNFTANDLMAKYHGETWARVELDYHGADNIYREIYNLKAMGYNMLAWGGSIYAEGVIFDDYGDVIGIKEDYLANARRFLDICREVGMPVMWNVYFHSSSCPDYYHAGTWNILAQMLCNPTVREHYAERFVAPLCDMLAEYPDVVAMVSIADEPENEINDNEKGNHFGSGRGYYGTTLDNMRDFMYAINEVVKEKLPNMPRTVASNDEEKTLYRDFALDLMGHNRYDNAGSPPATEAYVTYADIILAEYNVGGEFPGDDLQLAETLIKYRKNMMAEGYKGGFQWCWMPNSTPGAAYYLLYRKTVGGKQDNTAFRETVAELRYYMNDYRAEYRGETVALEPAVLYANTGDGKVEWIPSRQAVTVDVLRSDNGGNSWKTVAKAVDQASLVTKGKATYQDTDDGKPKSGFMYKVVSYDANGNKVESEPNDPAGSDRAHKVEYTFNGVDYPTNIAYQKSELKKDQADLLSFGEVNNRVYLPEYNLLVNSSFEDAEGGQWNNRSFLNTAVKVVEDPTAPDGNKSLFFDSTASKEGQWYKFTVNNLKPNTDYVFSTWVKGDYLSADNACKGSIGVIDPDTNTFMVYWEYYRDYARSSRHTEQIYPPCWDNEWHLRSVMFNTGDLTSYEIALYGYGSEMWVDDMHLYENGHGLKYTAGKNDSIQVGFLWDEISCDPADSAVADVTVDSDNYWQSGDGYGQGFVAVEKSNQGNGNVLKYVASKDPHGLYYLKWIDVEPNTDYYFSWDMQILESGLGRVVIMDGKLTGPDAAIAVDLDMEIFGEDWFSYYGSFNSGAYDRVAFGVLDQGGSCLVDNIRIFKKSDNNPDVKDLYLDSVTATKSAAYGKNATVTVNATGDGLKYAWYFKDKGASKFSLTTTFTGKTYTTQMNEARDGRQVYCVVTDKYGATRTTETTTLSLKKSTLKITTQPKSTYVANGSKAKVTVKAQGDGLKYTWYVKNASASKYSKSAITTATYSATMSSIISDRRLYCVITDAYGNSVKTDTVVMRRKVTIMRSPALTVYAKNGAKASVKLTANGDGLKYTWYVKNAGASKYTKSSITSATYSATMSSTVKDRLVYCVVSDKYGKSVTSKTYTLRMAASITKQPATVAYAKNGAKASVKITANGDGLKYTWYVKNAGASKYSKSSIKTATYSATMSSSVKNRKVYCVVTDKYGNSVTSKTYTLRMAATITTQPKTVTVKKNATAKVTVKAKGDGLKYTWYVKNAGASKYSKSSITKSTYSVKMTSKVKNRLVYCVVTDKYGNKVQSKTVRLKMK